MTQIQILCVSLLVGGCGSDLGDKTRGEACTRDAECENGLACEGGVCDLPMRDAGEQDATSGAPDAAAE